MHKKLISYLPEQIFLIQGNIETFKVLVQDASLVEQSVEQQSLARFTVDDARSLVEFNLERPSGSWCIIYFDVFVNDAAQILLKTLEEPKEGIHIVFVTPHPYLIPQTIRSRVRLILSEGLTFSSTEGNPPYLASKKAVTEYIKNTFGDDAVEASIRRAQATVFLDTLEQHVRNSPDKSKIVYEAKDMLFKANMPTKQVVEYAVSMIF